jgi:hypothetical protein
MGGVRFPFETDRIDNLGSLSAEIMFSEDIEAQIKAKVTNFHHFKYNVDQVNHIIGDKATSNPRKGTSGCLVTLICLIISTFMIYAFTQFLL